jgi:hypothetical protein
MHYRHVVEGILPEPVEWQSGLYWIDVERDLAYLPKRLFQKRGSLSSWLQPYLQPHVSAVYDPGDPKPLLKRYLGFVKQASRALFHPSHSKNSPEDPTHAQRRYST